MSDRLERIVDLANLVRYAHTLNKPHILDHALTDLKTEIEAYEQETQQ